MNKEDKFIQKAIQKFGYLYDYSKINYINSKTKITIICKKCNNEFKKTPANFLNSKGCKYCNAQFGNKQKFIEKATKIHKDLYDYSKVEYVNAETNIIIICNKCKNEFQQTPKSHYKYCGCKVCYGQWTNTKEFIEKALEIHQNKFDYSKVEYKNTQTHIIIKCNSCNEEFKQMPRVHLYKIKDCSRCGPKKQLTTKLFINQAQKIHKDKYDYSKVKYKGVNRKVIIGCKKCKQEYKQVTRSHLNGNDCCFCYIEISKGETFIKKYLTERNIMFEFQKRFKGNNRRPYDFYLPNQNLVIEYHGQQHFYFVSIFHRNLEGFVKQVQRDKQKKDFLENYNINFLEIHYNHNIEQKLSKFGL